MKKTSLISLLAIIAIAGGFSGIGTVEAATKKKVYTVYDRQVELRKKVEKSFKSNELTEKEMSKLNAQLDDINTDVDKMKGKNGGKLSYADEGKLEKRLNKVSLSLQKYQLTKRVVAH